MRTNRKRLFFSLATGLAVLAIGLVYSTTSPIEYTAVAVARLPGSAGDSSQAQVDDAALYTGLASRENLTAALAAIDEANGRAGISGQDTRRNDLAAALRTRWHVFGGDNGREDQRQLSIIYTGRDGHSAARTVNAVARHIAGKYADDLVEDSRNKYDAARLAVAGTKRQRDDAHSALDNAIAAHTDAIKAAGTGRDQANLKSTQAATNVAGVTAVDKTTRPNDAADSRPHNNPAWINLSDQLSHAEAELERFLEKKTPAHPLVRNSQWHVDQIRRLLAQTPRYLPGHPDGAGHGRSLSAPPHERFGDVESDAPATANQPTAVPNNQALEPVEPTSKIAETAEFVELRRQQLEKAETRHAESAAAERAAWEQYVTAKTAATGYVRPAVAADLRGRSAAILISVGTCIASLVAAFGVALFMRPRNRVLKTAEDARKHLSVPVVGVLSTA